MPELFAVAFELLRGFSFEGAEDVGERLHLRLGDEKVDVFRHEDVAEDVEVVTLAESFEGFFEDDSGVVAVQEWFAVIAAEGDEVVAAFRLVTLEIARRRIPGRASCQGCGLGEVAPSPTPTNLSAGVEEGNSVVSALPSRRPSAEWKRLWRGVLWPN